MSGNWTASLEELSSLPRISDPSVDAYRLYNIGLCKEALAYESLDQDSAKMLLKEATEYYSKSLSNNSKEKQFAASKTRTDGEVTRYLGPEESLALEETSHVMTNDDVIKMLKAGDEADYIVSQISKAKKVRFDLSLYALEGLRQIVSA